MNIQTGQHVLQSVTEDAKTVQGSVITSPEFGGDACSVSEEQECNMQSCPTCIDFTCGEGKYLQDLLEVKTGGRNSEHVV